MNANLVEEIRLNLKSRDTAELTPLWVRNDREQYSDEFFEAVRLLLQDRLASPLPTQQTEFGSPPPLKLSKSDKTHIIGSVLSGLLAYILLALLTRDGVHPILGVFIMAGGGLWFYRFYGHKRQQRENPTPLAAKNIVPFTPVASGGCSCRQTSGCRSDMQLPRPVEQGEENLPELLLIEQPTATLLYCLNPTPEPFFVRAEADFPGQQGAHFMETMLGAGEYLQVGEVGGGERQSNLGFILEVERLADGTTWRLSYRLHDASGEKVTLPQVGEGYLLKPWIGRKVDGLP